MNPSTFFSVSGVGSYWTTLVRKVEGSMSLALQSPSKMDWLVPAWIPMVLPARSATVRIGFPSSIERMQNGFFWNVALLGDQPGGGVGGGDADVDGAAGDEGVGAVHGPRDQVDLLEAGFAVVALGVGEVLAGELDVLDPGQLQGELAVGPRSGRAPRRGGGGSPGPVVTAASCQRGQAERADPRGT
jgi:hypothetical protein